MSTSVYPPSGPTPLPINKSEPLRQISEANGRTYAPIPDDLHGQRPQSIDSEAAPLSEHELARTLPQSDATVEPTKNLRDDIWSPTKKAQVPAEEAPPPANTPVPGKNEKVSEKPVVGRDISFEDPKPNEDYGVVPPGAGEARENQIPEGADARAETPVAVSDDDDLRSFAEGVPLEGEKKEGEALETDTVAKSEKSEERDIDTEDLRAAADIKEAEISLGDVTELSLSGDFAEKFAKVEENVIVLPKLEEKLKTFPPELKITEKIKAKIAEIKKNLFVRQVNGCRISGQRNGRIRISGDSVAANAILKNPRAFLSEEDCKILIEAKRRNQLVYATPEQEKRIQVMATEYADQYMQDLEQQIQQEIEALEQKKQQKSSTKLPDSSHTKPEIVQGKREELRPQRPEMTLLESLANMAHKNQIMLETAISEKKREKDRETKRELKEMDERYWETLEDNKKNAIRIFDSKIRETQKDEKKSPRPS